MLSGKCELQYTMRARFFTKMRLAAGLDWQLEQSKKFQESNYILLKNVARSACSSCGNAHPMRWHMSISIYAGLRPWAGSIRLKHEVNLKNYLTDQYLNLFFKNKKTKVF
jgi:hypothetical protein